VKKTKGVTALHYKIKPLDKGVSEVLLSHGILQPKDLTYKNLSKAFGVQVKRTNYSYAYFDDQDTVKTIWLNDCPEFERKAKFLKLLAHTQLHHGNQFELKDYEILLQNRKALEFSSYVAMPYHMLQFLKYDLNHEEFVEHAMHLFGIPENLVQERKRLIFQRQQLEKKAKLNTQKKVRWFA